jgi:hypothetical protein
MGYLTIWGLVGAAIALVAVGAAAALAEDLLERDRPASLAEALVRSSGDEDRLSR